MSQGVYRIGASAGGLPFPRRGLRASAVAIVAFSVIALVLPFVLLVGTGGLAVGRASVNLRGGGVGMYLLLGFEVAAPIALGAMGLVLVRGRKLPAAALFALAAVPYGNALASALSAMTTIVDALEGESVDPIQKGRILTEGLSETLANDTFGGYVAGAAAVIACIAASAAVATIDPGGARARKRSVAVGVSGVLWFVASAVIAAKSGERVAYIVPAAVAVMAVGAALAARSVEVLRDWHDRTEAARAAAALAIAALASLFAVAVLTRSVAANTTATLLAKYTVIAFQERAAGVRILGEVTALSRASSRACAVLFVLGAATWGGVLLPIVRLSVSRANILAFGAAVLLALGSFTLSRARDRAPEAVLPPPLLPSDVALPVVSAGDAPTRSLGGCIGGTTFLSKGGGRQPQASCANGGAVTVYADGATRFDLVRAYLPDTSACKVTLSLGTRRADARELAQSLGHYAPLLEPVSCIRARVDAHSDEGDAVMHVVSQGPDGVLIHGRKVALPVTEPVANNIYPDGIHYYFRASDTVDHVVRVVLNIEEVYRRSGDDASHREIDCIDCAKSGVE